MSFDSLPTDIQKDIHKWARPHYSKRFARAHHLANFRKRGSRGQRWEDSQGFRNVEASGSTLHATQRRNIEHLMRSLQAYRDMRGGSRRLTNYLRKKAGLDFMKKRSLETNRDMERNQRETLNVPLISSNKRQINKIRRLTRQFTRLKNLKKNEAPDLPKLEKEVKQLGEELEKDALKSHVQRHQRREIDVLYPTMKKFYHVPVTLTDNDGLDLSMPNLNLGAGLGGALHNISLNYALRR